MSKFPFLELTKALMNPYSRHASTKTCCLSTSKQMLAPPLLVKILFFVYFPLFCLMTNFRRGEMRPIRRKFTKRLTPKLNAGLAP